MIHQTSQQATADGAGRAVVAFNVPAGMRRMAIGSVALTVVPATPRPKCTAYIGLDTRAGSVNASRTLSSRLNGSSGSFDGQGDVVPLSSALIIEWTGATAGAICTASLYAEATQ